MFNATALLKQWNESAGEKKEIQKFFENQNTKEFISALIEEENLNGEKSAYLTSRGKYNGGTWASTSFGLMLHGVDIYLFFRLCVNLIRIGRSPFCRGRSALISYFIEIAMIFLHFDLSV